MFGSLEIKFPRLSGQSSSPHLMERHLPHFQPSSRRSLSCLPGWLKSSSSHLSHESMSKFTFLFHTQRSHNLIQRSLTAVCYNGDEGLLQAKPADREGQLGIATIQYFTPFSQFLIFREPIQQATFLQSSTSSGPDWTSLVNVFSAFQHFKLQHRTLYPDGSKTTKEAIDNLVGMEWDRLILRAICSFLL